MRRECDEILQKGHLWTWKSWHRECLRQMGMSLKQSTVESYGGFVKKWMPPEWNDKMLAEIGKRDVMDLIFETIPQK